MIQIYLPDNTDYEHNGDAVLDPMSCECEMVLNDEWHLELEHPIDEDGIFKMIIKEAVISAPTPMGERQLFRIYETQKDDETVTAYALPIFFDSKDDHILLDVRPTGKSGQEALDILCAESKYSGASDITTGATAYYVRRNLMEAINGDIDQSFINRWGGEILYDNYQVIINQHVGGDYGVRAEFGYNLEGIEEHVDMSEVVTRIIPVAYNGYTLDGDSPWVDSPRINDYAKIYTKEIYFDDVKMIEDASEDEEGCLTPEELWHKLIIRCNELFAQGIDLPKISYDVNMVSLEGTEEYKGYEILEKVGLGDTVHCRHKELGIETNARAISIKYDCIDRRNIEIVLGDYQKSAFDSDFELQKAIETVLDSKSKTVMAERVRGILDAVNTQLRLQSTVAKKVNGRAFEISDLDPESELYGCMIFGSQGLQIATERTPDGRDWNWRTAITAKGVVADAIITGLLSDKTGRNYWNLDTGEFRMTMEAFTVDGKTVEDIAKGAAGDAQDLAEAAEELAKTKCKVFINQPVPPYKICDLWVQGDIGDIMVSSVTRETGSFVASDWRKASNYSESAYYYLESNINHLEISRADGYIYPSVFTLSAYKQKNGTPPSRVSFKGKIQVYGVYSDGESTTTIYKTASGTTESTVDIQTSGLDEYTEIRCELWSDVDAEGYIYRLQVINIPVGRDPLTLNWEETFDMLTNNGKIQGLFAENGQIYINASFIRSGELILGGLNNQYGTFKLKDANDSDIGIWDKQGMTLTNSKGDYRIMFNTSFGTFDNVISVEKKVSGTNVPIAFMKTTGYIGTYNPTNKLGCGMTSGEVNFSYRSSNTGNDAAIGYIAGSRSGNENALAIQSYGVLQLLSQKLVIVDTDPWKAYEGGSGAIRVISQDSSGKQWLTTLTFLNGIMVTDLS